MTTRKRGACGAEAAALAVLLLLGGCATPGPLHIYTVSGPAPAVVHDAGSDATAAEVPSFVREGETLLGFAYDPFTDHFFLRFAPGDRFRVVDRPAKAVKREFTVAALALPASAAGGGDLAIRPRDGHVFAAHPNEAAVIEFNRFGEVIRTVHLATLNAPPAALAFDIARDRLLVLSGGDLARVATYDLSGQRLGAVALDRDVTLTTLAYDSDAREIYALIAKEGVIGIFNDEGHLLRTAPLPASSTASATLLDVGPRSFLRLF